MNKQEKYINYIVDDLIKKTEIDYGRGKIKCTFLPSDSYFGDCANISSFFSTSTYSTTFSVYMSERYGAKDEEMKIIWGLYKERIKELIDNE